MATTRTQFTIKQYAGFGGNFVDSDMLAASYNTAQPHVFDNTLAKIFTSSNRFNGKPLIGMTQAKGNVKEIDTEIYRWTLQGAEEKPLRVMENIEPTNTTIGIGRTLFKIKLDDNYFAHPDVLMGEDPDYAIEVIDGPLQDGVGYIYTCRLQTDDMTKYLPSYLLDPGREFSKVWTTVSSEFNDQFGTQQYASSFQLESQVSAFAQKFTLTDKALREQGRISVDFLYTDPSTNQSQKITKFMPMAEAKMHDELYRSMEAQMWYGEKSTSMGPGGYWKKTGPGLRQQMRDGHIEYYNGTLTEQRLIDYLMSIFFSRVDEGDRKITVMTGTGGSIMFHKMMAASAKSFFTMDSNFIRTMSENPKHLAFGAQFTHYQGPEGIEVTVIKNPLYDDRRYCKRMHPDYPDRPIDSWRMTFLDFGRSGDNMSNINMLKVKDTYRYGYEPGTVTPMGPVQGGAVNNLKAGCTWFVENTCGIWMVDPTRSGELILDFED